MKNEHTTSKSTVSSIYYLFVFCPRYRRKIFLDKAIETRFKELTEKICQDIEVELLTLTIGDDYVKLSLKAPPHLSPSKLMAKIKGTTSRQLRNEFPTLKHLESLWTRIYFVSTESDVPSKTIRTFINNQKTRG